MKVIGVQTAFSFYFFFRLRTRIATWTKEQLSFFCVTCVCYLSLLGLFVSFLPTLPCALSLSVCVCFPRHCPLTLFQIVSTFSRSAPRPEPLAGCRQAPYQCWLRAFSPVVLFPPSLRLPGFVGLVCFLSS